MGEKKTYIKESYALIGFQTVTRGCQEPNSIVTLEAMIQYSLI